MQGPQRPRNAEEEARNEDDDIPPAPRFIFDSVALVDVEATESDKQPEPVQEQDTSRSAVEEFIIFESCGPASG